MFGNFAILDSPRRLVQFWQNFQTSLVLLIPNCTRQRMITYTNNNIPRANGAKCRSGRKPGARVTNSARLFTPGKMRTQRSVKYINNRGRVTMFQGWTSH